MINAQEVEDVFKDCLFQDGEDTSNHIKAPGIVHPVGFHPGRLAKNKEKIVAFLSQLPTEFHKNSGGGWSFLNACMTKDGEQWGEHINMEQLFQLGEGLGMVKCQLPKEVWPALPGGMPYYVIDLEAKPS